MIESLVVRRAAPTDLDAIRRIYNEGIVDRIATLEAEEKSAGDIVEWWREHDEPYQVVVAVDSDEIAGWASLNRFSDRCAHAAIADLSVYVARSQRGRGVGFALLRELERQATDSGFRKIVLQALDRNEYGKRLYRKAGFVEVGVFREHGLLDGRYVDVIVMEKLI